MFGKYKEMLHLLLALFSEANARIFRLRVPGFCAFGRECVFSFSFLSSDGVSAQQGKKSVFSVSLLWRKKCGHCAAAAQTFARVVVARKKESKKKNQEISIFFIARK